MTSALHLNPVLGAPFSFSLAGASSVVHRCHNYNQGMVIRCSKSGEPLRRPSLNAPPASPSTLPLPSPPVPIPAPDFSPAPPAQQAAPPSTATGTTIEYQRQRAKEMQDYFLDKKFEDQTSQARIFGWTRKNEIYNGRWVMFGLAVGLLTEYATGSDFVEQLKIIVSNLGILDLD